MLPTIVSEHKFYRTLAMNTFLLLALLANATHGFVAPETMGAHMTRLQATTLSCPSVDEGQREILDGDNGPILVTKVAGSYYAVDATCPHLGLPMKKGKVSNDGGTPTLTCSFHNSCFELGTGKCTKWVSGALGVENGFISGIMGKVGGKQQDVKAYFVMEEADGSLVVSSEPPAPSSEE
jgi:nitrite reductase/ring-hydroxylating ferredoxin subunit|eukprot:g10070.t1 g10070   contig4:1162123-1162662(-)